MAVAGLGFLVVIKVVSPGLLGTFLGLFQNAGQDDSVQWRTHDYATAEELISQHLWLGRGIGTWYAPKHEVFDNQYLLTLVDSRGDRARDVPRHLRRRHLRGVRVRFLCSRLPERAGLASTDRDLALSRGRVAGVVFPTFATFDFTAFPTVTSLAFLLVGMAAALLRVVMPSGGRAARSLRHRLTAIVAGSRTGRYCGPGVGAASVHGPPQQWRDR